METGHDQKSFVIHYQEVKNALFNYLSYRLNFDRALAEDLMMDVVVKAYEGYHSFDPNKGSFKNWIFTIAHNHLVNTWRRDSKKVASLDALMEEGVPLPASYMEESVSQEIDSRAIQRVLALLKEEERELIILRYLNDMDIEEIAHLLRKNSGAIRTALYRALGELRSKYLKIYPPLL